MHWKRLRQKCDLNDKLNENNKRNKVRDVFGEGLESPHCAGVLYNWLQNLEKKLNKIFEVSSSTKEVQIQGARYMGKLINLLISLMENLKAWNKIESENKNKFWN